MLPGQEVDDLAWARSDDLWEKGVKKARLSSTCRRVEALAAKVLARPATYFTPLVMGAFNILYPIHTEGPADCTKVDVLVRLPAHGRAVFPEEKTLAEAATALCISHRTSLPDLGPRRALCKDLRDPLDLESRKLRADISESALKCMYEKMARMVLQLAQPTFPRIGSLLETSPGSFQVLARPLTLNMNQLVSLSNVPASVLPPKDTKFQTADEWYTALAEMHIATLVFQHNDMVESEDDCRSNYVARQLFRRLARQGRLSSFGFAQDNWSAQAQQQHDDARGTLPAPAPDSSGGPFRLWSDDLRPSNVVVDDEDTVLGVIDWKFAYVAPTQFALDPPWWLLLEAPEVWYEDLDDWAAVYETRLQTWLLALEEAERDLFLGAFLLSAYMRESWATGRFWLNYAARKGCAFDSVYWKYLDEQFFGERKGDGEFTNHHELWETKVHLLSPDERAAMERMVQTKLEEKKERVLVEWGAAEARNKLSSYLFD
ncbi:hypothetical protein N658DRAFT_568708 [Parathielavia hyrcaniae]|uniref:Aminoglycoside phosphotransferase domain-containing protein n=1 Tax=Parathielavia hyrcaniae TaxID=113614 RepID=A0AAN6PWR0_9PEZI|nr:hypothetical protein N658DRAFT_568708 [Parathielavia hyrcaniae]